MKKQFTIKEREKLCMTFDWIDDLLKKIRKGHFSIEDIKFEIINEILEVEELLPRLSDYFDDNKIEETK